MEYRYATGILRLSVAAFLAGMLGACATTQKSSSGLGTTEDDATARPAPASAAVPAPRVSAQAGQSDGTSGAPAQASGQSAASGTTDARNADGASGASATTIRSEDIDTEKRALADEQARIDKLHAAQEADRQSMDAAKAEPSGAQAPSTGATPAQTASATQTNRAAGVDDAQVVFPENSSASIPDHSKTPNEDGNDASNQSANGQIARKPLQYSVYFDFDKSLIKEQYDPILKAQADFLEAHKNFSAEIQGNCDERGSREYNLSLGQKRADAVKRSLVLLGAKEDQVESVSLGEEKPKNAGHDEAAWSENRRADILYKAADGRGEF